ncbi:retrovirus-related pol polyprotein from transposon TNT 1-94 [Tanacetum coccineum]
MRTKHNIHPTTDSPLYYSQDENVLNTLRFVGKDKEGGATESSKATKVTKPKAAKVTKPAGDSAPKKRKLVEETLDDPLPTKRSKAGLVGKRRKAKSQLKLIDEPSDEGVPVEEPVHDDEEADLQRDLELSLKDQGERTQGPARPVVLREPDSDKFQPLPKEASKINARNQEEGQASPNLVYKMKARLDQTLKPKQMDEEFTTTAYPNVQENLKLLIEDQFFVEKTREEEPGKTNAEAEVQSMVLVPIHQDTSSVPPMTTLVSQAVDEIVTDAVDWVMQAPLRARFRDLPTVDMKEILQQRMFEDNSYQAHNVYNDLYEALQKSLELDYSNQRLAHQEEARKKR